MKRSHWMTAAAAVLVLAAAAPLAWTAPVPADMSPLAWVPADAPLVVHLNGVESLRDHVVAFLKNAVPDRAELVQEQSETYLKVGFAGRKLRGVAKDGPIFVVFTELPKDVGPDKPPKVAILLAVTDYAEFRDNILIEKEKKSLKPGEGYESFVSDPDGKTDFLVDRKGYAVITPIKDLAEAFAKAPTAGLDGKMSKAQAAKFLSSDLGVYVNMAAVNKEYADQIKKARESADELLQKAEKQDDKSMKMALSLGKQMVGPLFQAVEDSQTALVTEEVRPGGVAEHFEVGFQADSKTAGFFKDSKLGAFKDLEKLPAGQFAYVGMSISPALTKLIGPLMHGLAADPDSSKGAKALGEAFEQWVKAGPTEQVVSTAMPPAGVSILKCAEPKKAVKAAVQLVAAQGEEGGFQAAFLKGKAEVKADAEKYKDIEFTYIHMEFDFDKLTSGKEIPEAMRKTQREMMQKMMGEGMTTWLGTDGKEVVQVTAKDWEAAKKLLDQYYKGENTVGDDKAFVTARKELPAEATIVELIDVMQYANLMLDILKPALAAVGNKAPVLKLPEPVKGQPSYIGFAATLEGDSASMDCVVTAESVNQIYKGYIMPLLPKGN